MVSPREPLQIPQAFAAAQDAQNGHQQLWAISGASMQAVRILSGRPLFLTRRVSPVPIEMTAARNSQICAAVELNWVALVIGADLAAAKLR